jgi:Ca-activated chloride channel family protein
MEFLAPRALLLLGLIPLGAAFYAWLLNRRRRYTVRFPSLSLVRAALPKHSAWQRHAPFALFLLGAASLSIAAARPATVAWVPAASTTIVLAMDISRSMCANDIAPNRMAAAKAAARDFVQRQPRGTQVGIVAFAGLAELVQAPTNDPELLLDAIDRLYPARRTAIGSAILASLQAIAEVDPRVPPVTEDAASSSMTPPPEGARVPHVIVLLTDGANNAGPWPTDAALQAANRGVRIYTIGFGTAYGSTGRLCGREYADRVDFGFGFVPDFYGGGMSRGIDEQTLREVADMTGGAYYPATSAAELQHVLAELPITVLMKEEYGEISAAFVALAMLLAVPALILGWTREIST